MASWSKTTSPSIPSAAMSSLLKYRITTSLKTSADFFDSFICTWIAKDDNSDESDGGRLKR